MALLAPPCQETNPDFDDPGSEDAAASTDAADDDGATVGSTSTASADTGPGTADASSTSPDATGPLTTSADTGPIACEDPMLVCAGACVDAMTNPDHCGTCNNKCNPAHEACVMGECVAG